MFSKKICLLHVLLFVQLGGTVSEETPESGDGHSESVQHGPVEGRSGHRSERQLVGVHILEPPSIARDSGKHGGHGYGGGHGGHGFGGGHGGYGGHGGHGGHGGGGGFHDPHGGGGYGHDIHGGGYGHDIHGGGGGGYGHHHDGYKEPPKKIKKVPYYGPQYGPYDLVAPDKSKKGKTKYGDDPVNESKKGGYHKDRYDKPIKHFGGFGGGGSIGYNAGSLKGGKGHGGYKGGGGHGGGGYGGGGHKGGGYGGGGHKGGGYGHGISIHKGHGGGGYKGHGGHKGGGFKLKGFKGFKGHGGGFKGHGGGHKGHGGGGYGHGGGHKIHGGGGYGKGGGHKIHGGGGYGHGGGHKIHGGGGYGHGGGIHKGAYKESHEGGDHGGYSDHKVQVEYIEYAPNDHKGYEQLAKPYNTYDAHADVRIQEGKGVDVSHMLLSDPYKASAQTKKESIPIL